ncbi:SF II RNA helicase [Cryptosporidium sp. chipmunk genotype I]|uniref:SF II RNA helicase n=1 Tax=Cryptosporidium sp. chipmunk genotype I TaxID=1280935 RepID=UPI00351A7327|nr:SF II RNA helicase [Cryptosporidium sp. chipmunk genotype I]
MGVTDWKSKGRKLKKSEEWKQSSLNNFMGLGKKNSEESEDDFENDELLRVKELENSIETEKAQEDRIQELFCRYKLKVDNLNRENKVHDEDIAELKKGLRWGLSYLKLEDYRKGQKDAIEKLVCERKDVVLILPTGGGKSLTYQLPSLLREYQKHVKEIPSLSKGMVTVVLSPLIALIEDQINSLRKWGVKSNGLSSTIIQKSDSSQSINMALEELYIDLEKKVPTNSIIYVTPESFGTEKVLGCLYKLYLNGNLYCFAIDEAHCISEWGHDFRTAYRRLNQIKNIFSDIPVLACTATASPKVQKDIRTVLNLRDPYVSVNSFNRPNIHYTAYNIDNNDYLTDLTLEEIVLNGVLYMQEYFKRIDSKETAIGIVYVNSRKSSEHLSQYLSNKGVPSKAYHAGLSLKIRTQIQNEWLENKIQVLVGTIAFGMGVHKPNVRFVIHSSIPDSIDSYYQQSGRAGRDSKFSKAMLFFSKRDITCLRSIKRKSLQYLFMKSQQKAQQAFEKFQDNLQSVIEFAQCNNSEYQEMDSYYEIDYDPENRIENSANGKRSSIEHYSGSILNLKPQDPNQYQIRINKYGQCRRIFLLGYFGEKLNKEKSSTNCFSCCDVCDSKHKQQDIHDSFMSFVSSRIHIRNSPSKLFKKNYNINGYKHQFTKHEEFSFEYNQTQDPDSDYIQPNKVKSSGFSSAFKSAKSFLDSDPKTSKNSFQSALKINNQLKSKGMSYLERLKALEEQEVKSEEKSSTQNSKLNIIRNSLKKKKRN